MTTDISNCEDLNQNETHFLCSVECADEADDTLMLERYERSRTRTERATTYDQAANTQTKGASLAAAMKFLRYQNTSQAVTREAAATERGVSRQSLDHHIKNLIKDGSAKNLRLLGEEEEIELQRQLQKQRKQQGPGWKGSKLWKQTEEYMSTKVTQAEYLVAMNWAAREVSSV